MKELKLVHRIILGLLMLVPGIVKFVGAVSGNNFAAGMLSNIALFAWAPVFWAWVLIIFEIGTGAAIISNWKVKKAAIFPAIILLVALLTVAIRWSDLGSTSWTNVLFHLLAIVDYGLLMSASKK